ncbi:Lrp/AsnC family transcriptional regulator [Streptomyces sp. NPDC056568]|uniref:Lrp/AsnC family transcriptional regulator n=1 Tax=Streptomyces sp. NPDC056568 TaxID=3345866 RepID=UPI0036B20C8C
MARSTRTPLDELDLALVNALQINPRAPWTEVGAALNVDPATVARRWQRLREGGYAWVTAYPYDRGGSGALIEVDCAPGQDAAVAGALAREPMAATIELTAGGRDVLVTALAGDFGSLTSFILDRIGVLPGVTATRAYPVTGGEYVEGSSWRLRSLARSTSRALAAPVRPPLKGTEAASDATRDLALALAEDGRLPLTDLADRLGVSLNTASRRLNRLMRSGDLVLRCDLAPPLSGAPVSVTFFASVPSEHLDATAREVARFPEIRLCVAVAGPQNLLAVAWVATLTEVHLLEIRLARALPHLRVADRSIALRITKHMGRILNAEGRAQDFVAVDMWAARTEPGPGPGG